LIFTKFGGKVAHKSQKKPLDFGGNLDHVKLGRVRVKVRSLTFMTLGL